MLECENEKYVRDFFGLPDTIKDTDKVDADFGLLTNLVAMQAQKKNKVQVQITTCQKCGDYREMIIKNSDKAFYYKGDNYHNGIDMFQKSYLQALTDFGFEIERTDKAMECIFACDED